MKTTQDPFKTTVKGIKNTANIRAVVRSIQSKIIMHGVCSDQEQAILEQYTDFGQQRDLQTERDKV